MNETNMESETTELFDGMTPTAPPSCPPHVSLLRQRLQRRKKIQRRSMAVGVVAAACVCFMTVLPPEQSSPIESTERITSPATIAVTPLTPHLGSSVEPHSPDEEPIRVLAMVSRPVAVFDLDEETQIVRHVGWIESKETVAVDLDEFTQSHRQFIEAAMSEETPPVRLISL